MRLHKNARHSRPSESVRRSGGDTVSNSCWQEDARSAYALLQASEFEEVEGDFAELDEEDVVAILYIKNITFSLDAYR